MKVLFIAGFGPITSSVTESRRLYQDALGIRFKVEEGEYLHTEEIKGANTFAVWPLAQAADSCFGRTACVAGVRCRRHRDRNARARGAGLPAARAKPHGAVGPGCDAAAEPRGIAGRCHRDAVDARRGSALLDPP
jgi:hypothetical protein